MTVGICAGGALRMSTQLICLRGMNKSFFSQDTRGRGIPYLCVVPHSSPSGNRSYKYNCLFLDRCVFLFMILKKHTETSVKQKTKETKQIFSTLLDSISCKEV